MRKSPLMAVLSAFFFLSGPVQAASAPPSSMTKASLTVGQPGVVALQRMHEQALSSPQQVAELVTTMMNEDTYKRMFSRLKKNEVTEAADVLLALQDGQALDTFLKQQAGAHDAKSLVRAAMVLFPLDRYDLYRTLQANPQLDQKALKKWASSTGLMTQPMYAKSMTEGKAIFVEPLIESASITLPNQTKQASATVEYRVKGSADDKWQSGRELVWEPVQGVLTGPLVYLKPDTRYEVKVALTTAEGKQQTLAHEFTTRADKPPIDPNKVYYLSDIYKGGTLDLEKLKINGSDSGWAKIVNDKDITIEAGKGDRYAIDIGKAHHVYFENIKVRGGRVHGIYAEQAHHIWINQCDIAGWGRQPNIMKNGVAYEKADADPINYDSGIHLRQSGVITVENCHIHDPVPASNDWRYGHPKGPNAFFANANHPDPAYKGQVIIRNNRFEGKPDHRFNDVIEGRKNSDPKGGFVRDSAIYNNVFRYGNDDSIEIDGGQYNVMVYNNDMSHTYTGVSVIPTRVGPSYVFNNYIHDLGDETGKQWAGIKIGGLLTGGYGTSYLFHNLITVNRNGFTASRFQEDSTMLTYAKNNIVVTLNDNDATGYNLFDPEDHPYSQFINNYMFNTALDKQKIKGHIDQQYQYPELENSDQAQTLVKTPKQAQLPKAEEFVIPNFTQLSEDGKNFIYGIVN